MAYFDTDGFVFLMGRSDDIINIGGEKVSPFEIENTIKRHNGIDECCCVSIDDPNKILGKVPLAFITVESTEKYSEEELVAFLKKNIENYKIPYKIIVLDKIPKNTMGKFLRTELLKIWYNSSKG
jgi:long-chain acyl-CoA synthetase